MRAIAAVAAGRWSAMIRRYPG